MARNIALKANLAHPLVIQNRTQHRAEDFAASLPNPAAVQVAATVDEAVATAGIVFTSLGNDASVRDMYGTILKACGGSLAGKLFVETSTILPQTTNEVSELVIAAGGEFVAAPGT
jgi:3-hydroxyisobutyrate dehydrogenase-like beta-hydroxyacid dehydrogenase